MNSLTNPDLRLALTGFDRDYTETSLMMFELACLYGIEKMLTLFSSIDVSESLVKPDRLTVRKLLHQDQVVEDLMEVAQSLNVRYILYGGTRPIIDSHGVLTYIDLEINLFDAHRETHVLEWTYSFDDFAQAEPTLSNFTPAWEALIHMIQWCSLACVAAINPTETMAWVNRAQSLELADNLKHFQAIVASYNETDDNCRLEHLIELSETAPNMLLMWLDLAKVAKHTGDIEIALTSLKNAWELLPDTVLPLTRAKIANEIGMCFALVEQTEQAYEWWYRAIEFDKHFVSPYFSLALSLERNERYAETESLLKQVIGLAPRDIRIYTHLARLFSMQARWDEAIVQYRQLVTLEPKDPWFHNDLANCYLQLGDMENAKKHFQRTVLLDPKGEAGKTASFIIDSMETIEI